MTNRGLPVFVIVFLLWCGASHAGPLEDLNEAREKFSNVDFPGALEILNRVVVSGQLNADQLVDAYGMIARIQVELGDEDAAIGAFCEILKLAPLWRPDRNVFVTREIELFNRALERCRKSEVKLLRVELAPVDNALKKGETRLLTPYGTYSDGTRKELAGATWSSGDPAVAGVDAAGNVTAKSKGTVRITVTFEGLSASSVFNVRSGSNRLLFVGGGGAVAVGVLVFLMTQGGGSGGENLPAFPGPPF